MNNCQSCGMPMDRPEDFGGSRVGNLCCRYCGDEGGNLLPRETIREKMIQFQMQSLGKTKEQAEIDVDKHMALMPAWKITPSQPINQVPRTMENPLGVGTTGVSFPGAPFPRPQTPGPIGFRNQPVQATQVSLPSVAPMPIPVPKPPAEQTFRTEPVKPQFPTVAPRIANPQGNQLKGPSNYPPKFEPQPGPSVGNKGSFQDKLGKPTD